MVDLKRVLVAAPLWPGSSAVPRTNGLRALGLDVTALDTSDWWGRAPGLLCSLAHRVYCTASVRAMNQSLLRAAAENRPDVLWIDKGFWVYPWTLQAARRHARFLVHHTTDDAFGKREYAWLYRLGVRLYDLHLTSNRFSVTELPDKYGVRVVRAGMGYDRDFHVPQPGVVPHPAKIVFIGHWEAHSEQYVRVLRRAGFQVEVWGHHWRKARHPEFRSVRPLPGDRYLSTIAGAAIALCFLARGNRNESTGRSFEIPAIGSFMLAERTDEHEYLYGDGVGAAFFSNTGELLGKARHYLEHEEERRTIAATGQARCMALGLSWQDHMRREWPIVERMLTAGGGLSAADDEPFWDGFRGGQPVRLSRRRSPLGLMEHQVSGG
jgi:hypothetical protein